MTNELAEEWRMERNETARTISYSIEQPIIKQEGQKTIVKGLELKNKKQKKVGHVIHNSTRSVSYRSLCNPLLFSSLGQALFLLGASVPLTSSSLFLPLVPLGGLYTRILSLHSFILFSVFPLFAHIFIIHPFAHINLLPCF